MNRKSSEWEIKILLGIAILFTLAYAQAIFFPIVLAFFLYLLFDPVVEWLVRIKLPRVLASTLVVCLLLTVISSGITSLVQPASSWIDQAPSNFQTIGKKFVFLKESLGKLNKAAETAKNLTEVSRKDKITIVTPSTNIGSSIFDLTSNLLILIFTVLMLLFFLLIYFRELIQRYENILYKRKKSKNRNDFLVALQNEVSVYLFTFSLICIGLGILLSIIFLILGMPNPLLWGGMATFLTFIPFIGHLAGIIIVLFVSLITFDSYFYILAPPSIYLLLAIIEGQIITPIFLGNRLNLNPLLIFINLLIWDALWGISGIIISVPLLVTIKIVLEYVPGLSKFKRLLEY